SSVMTLPLSTEDTRFGIESGYRPVRPRHTVWRRETIELGCRALLARRFMHMWGTPKNVRLLTLCRQTACKSLEINHFCLWHTTCLDPSIALPDRGEQSWWQQHSMPRRCSRRLPSSTGSPDSWRRLIAN